MVQEGCVAHENKAVEFYCEVDDELTCSYCMLMGNHIGHQVKTLVEKNKSCAEDLKNSLENISHMQKQFKYTDHLLCETIPKEKVDISNVIKEVHDYFHKLHASLQTSDKSLPTVFRRSSKSDHVWRCPGQRNDPAFTIACHIGSQPEVMVWSVISFECRTRLVIIRGNLQHSDTSMTF
ncbi:uncharacterized protein TNCV_2930661 [Trichonephila clavipes]|nr:uncharacterized protein TNCV_2930661 [Trichonephila clavipes]